MLKRIWGIYDGPPEYIYLPPDSKARTANMHTLDINELYVRLYQSVDKANPVTISTEYNSDLINEVGGNSAGLIFDHETGLVEPQTIDSQGSIHSNASLIFDPEPWCHIQVGHMTLKPDAYIDVGKRYFLEMDLATMFRSALAEKMRRYISAYEQWNEDRFPKVLFVCHDADRKRFIESVIKRQTIPALFTVMLFDEVVDQIAPTAYVRSVPELERNDETER